MRFSYKTLGIISAVGIVFLLGIILLNETATKTSDPKEQGFALFPVENLAQTKEDVCSSFEGKENEECVEATELALRKYQGTIQSASKEEVVFSQGEDRETSIEVSGTFWVVSIALESLVETPEGVMRYASIIANLQEQTTILYQLSPTSL